MNHIIKIIKGYLFSKHIERDKEQIRRLELMWGHMLNTDEYAYFLIQHPEAEDWFDENGKVNHGS